MRRFPVLYSSWYASDARFSVWDSRSARLVVSAWLSGGEAKGGAMTRLALSGRLSDVGWLVVSVRLVVSGGLASRAAFSSCSRLNSDWLTFSGFLSHRLLLLMLFLGQQSLFGGVRAQVRVNL